MSFFFDVWTYDGFVLASDVRLTEQINEEPETHDFVHKIIPSPHWRTNVKCAIAICGVDPEFCKNCFVDACAKRDTLKSIAKYFATKWTEHFAGTSEYSAVHLVGYERFENPQIVVPQMWYWHTWSSGNGYLSEERLQEDLSTFADPIPYNNHLPWKIKELTGKFPTEVPDEEHSLVMAFLRLYQPYFTWNGDTSFWRSAGGTVGSALNLLWRQRTTWTLQDAVTLTNHCLQFLTNVAQLLPTSTVGVSPKGEFDVLTVTPEELQWVSNPKLPNHE